ncbi:MAG: hypothetical protein H9535_15525, partial [Ignavibacteria bacterium]|nr:hypothetical protein [Ignavibacteria bacterium]
MNSASPHPIAPSTSRNPRFLRFLVPVIMLCSLFVGAWTTARATTFTVINTNDAGAGSLRQAILDANADGSATAGSPHIITITPTGTVTLASALPALNNHITINGPGAALIVSGNNLFPVFFASQTAAFTIQLNNFTIADGLALGTTSAASPGGVKSGTGGGGGGMGGGLFVNQGTVAINGVTFSNNQAIGGNSGNVGGAVGNGNGTAGGNPSNQTLLGTSGGTGGIAGMCSGTVGGFGGGGGGGAIQGGCSSPAGSAGGFGGGGGGSGYLGTGGVGGGGFGGNGGNGTGCSNGGSGGGGAGLGGAVFVRSGSTFSMSGCTFSNNTATGGVAGSIGCGTGVGANGQGKGGAIFIQAGATATEYATTYSTNTGGTAGTTYFNLPQDNPNVWGNLTATYYYQAGDPAIPGNWNSLIGGGGIAALNFTTGGETFVVPSGRTANVSIGGMTVGAGVTFQVAVGGTMTVGSGITLVNNGAFITDDVFRLDAGSTFTNTGTFTVNATGTLRLVDNASMTGSVVTYSTAAASLEYFGTAAPTISTVTFPNAMSGSVIINNSGGVTLNAAKTIAGTLTLTNGILTTSAANMLTMSNSAASAVAGGSATSFVQGPMRRAMVTSVTTYSYPVGKGGTYLPFGIVNPTVTATPVVEVEAFSVGGGGTADGTTINTLSSTEYWRAAVFSGTFTNALMQIGKTGLTGTELIGVATAAAGAYTSNGAISFAGGTPPSLTQTVVNTLPAARFFAVGTVVPITYYYESGNANVPGSWGTTSGAGLGTPATSFSTISSSFVVEASSPTATAVANFTLGTGIPMTVQSGCTLAISTGFTMTNNGTLNIAGGATLNLQGSGAVVGSAVTYQASNSLLSYTGTVGKTTTAQELPAIMPGSVTVAHTGVFSLGSSSDIQGTFTVNAGVNVRCATPQTLSLSGPIVFNGAFLGITGLSIVIKGSGSYTGGSFNTGGGLFVDMTMNRAGLALPTATMYLSGTLTLTAGTIVPTGKIKMYSSAAGAVTSSGGYVDTQGTGGLERELPAGATGVDYIFPVGRGAQYLPFTLKAPFNTTSAVSYSLEVKSYSTAPTGVPDCSSITSVSATEYWTGFFSGSGGTPVLTGGVALTAPSVGAGSVVGIGGAPLYSAMPGGSVVGGSTVTANTTPLNFGTALRNFAVGNTVAPTVYTFVPASGDPTVLTNWSPLPPNFTTQCSEFVIPNGKTALMVGNWTLGAGSSGVKLTVQSGGTLNTGTGAANAVQFAGTGSTFNLDNGATFITRNTTGINGTSDITGAIQVIGGATGFTTNYGTLVNFSFGTVAGAGQCRFGAVGQKTAITQVASLSTNTPTGSLWSLSSALTVQNALTVVAGDFYFQNSLVLNGVAGSSTVQGPDGRMLPQNATSVLTITNPNGLTVQNGGTFDVLDAAPVPCVLSNDITYQAGAILGYFGITTPRTTGRELPSAMDGSIRINGGSAAGIITLGGATAINGTGVLNLSAATSPLATSAANMLTINNPIVGAVNTGTGYVRGPMRRAIPAGANTGTWEFPISKGVTSLPFALVNPNSVGGSVVEAEAFNTNPVGTADGTTIQTGTISTTEYWQASVFSGGAVTARMLLSKTTLAATQTVGSASAVGGPYSAPSASTYNNLTLDNLTQNTPQTLLSPNFFAVGTVTVPTTYYYVSGAPHTAANWNSVIGGGGTAAANFTTSGWTFIVPNGYTTAAATANIPLSAGVTLQVAGGGTLNMAGFAVTGAGNFDLQANGTLQISRTDGVNGNSAATGAIQLTGTVSYAATANYILNVPGAVSNANFAAVGVKPFITNAQNLTITGNQFITLATGLALSGALTVNCASASAGLNLVAVSAQTLALNGPGSVIQSGVLGVGNNFTLANNNGVTPLSLASSGSAILRTMATALPLPIISGNPVNYASSSYLEYLDAVTGTRNTGAELPPIMNGAVMVAAGAGSVFILSAPSTLNATINFGADGRIVSTPTNLLTIGNPSAGSIIGASATRCITGALARTTSIGANTYLFPLGGGTAATYIPATFSYTAGATNIVTIEGFNSGAPGAPGGGLGSLSGTEYWRVNPSVAYSNVTLTFTRNAAILAGNTLSNSATAGGTYNAVTSNIASPSINNAPAFASLTAGDGFYSIASPGIVYYYESGDPAAPGSWGTTSGAGLGAAATNFTTPGSIFVVETTYTTAAASANISLGASVTMRVLNGGTLNLGIRSLIGTGSFDLQAGGTLQTSNPLGINGVGGAIDVPVANITYSPTASYVFGALAASGNCNLGPVGGKPAITQAQNVTINPGAGRTWSMATSLNVAATGALTISSGQFQYSGGTLTLNSATNTLASGAEMLILGGTTLNNLGTFTVDGVFTPFSQPLTFLGNSPTFTAGGELRYGNGLGTYNSSIEFPASAMPGRVSLYGGITVNLTAPRTIGATGILQLGGILNTSGGLLTINNTAVGAITGASSTSYIDGPLARALPTGAGVGQWLFPVGKGGTYLPFAINTPTSSGAGSTVQVEAFNIAPAFADGTTLLAPLGSEYWQAQVTTAPGSFTSGFVQVARTGITAANSIGSSTTAPPTMTTYTSNGANTVGTLSSISSLTRTATDNLAAPTYFAIGTAVVTYYYNNANVFAGGANNPANWDTSPGAAYGTAAPNFTTANALFTIDAGSTALLTADLPFGSGANNVTLTVPSGATLNTATFAVQFAGNNSVFNLQGGATLQTSHPSGINGIGNNDGAVQITGGATGVSINYSPAANYILGAIGATTTAYFNDISGNKQAITQAANLTVNPGLSRTWIVSGVSLALSGSLTVQSGILSLGASTTLNLNGAGSAVQSAASLVMNTGSQIGNTGGLTIQTGASFWIEAAVPATWVTGSAITYNVGSQLVYNNITSPLTVTGLELPGSMIGMVSLYGPATGVLTLSSATNIVGSGTLFLGMNGVLRTSTASMLTLSNSSPGAVSRTGSGFIDGPFRRALLPGASIGQQWLFPVGKGGTYLPFAVNDPTTAGGATIEVEAYNTAPTGGSTDGITISGALGAEYWRAQVASGSFTSGLMQAATAGLTAANLLGSSTTAPPMATAYASNGANVLGTLTAVSSLTRSIADNLAAPTYFAVGAVVPIYYYNTGDAATPGNWWTGIGGTGTPATNFTTPGTTFIVEPTHTPATGLTNFTLGANVTMNVQNNATLQIANGTTLTNNSTLLNVQAGGTLRIMGNGAVSTTPVNYLATTSTLEYAGAGLKTSTTIELPLVMPGSLLINKTAPIPTLALGANAQISGTLTAQAGSFDISGRTLQANGAIVFSGGSINASATATLDIAGTGSITGSALFTGIMGSLSMNRAAATLVLGTPLDISAAGFLTLNQGFIQTTPTNILRTTNTAPGAIVGTFGANSHIVGPLRRSLAAAGTYSFPVGGGTAATYNPATLVYTAGGGTVEVEPFFTAPPSVLTSGLMGSLGSASEYWRVTPSVALTNADLTFQRVPGMTNGVNLLGVAPTANGTYNGYTSTVAGSTIVNTVTFPTLAAGNGFYAVGTGVTTFYYRGGGFDPNIAGNWYTGLGGTGSPAPNFTGAGYTFIVPSPETAVLTGNFNIAATVLLQVAIGGTLDVGGFQVTGVGDFDLQLGGTLRAANATGFNGGAIVNTSTRTWSPGANYIFAPTVGPDVNINIATAIVNNLTTQGAGATRINTNLQVNGVLTGNGRITNCTATLTLGAGTHTLTQEMWFANTSVLTVNGTLNVSTASGAITLIGNGGCGVGSGVVNGSGQINYAVGSSLNAGSNWIGTIPQVALPAIMNGNVSMSGGVLATLGASVSSQINGTFSLNGSSRLNIGAGNTLTLNDAITLGAGSTFGGTATSNISVAGTGTITGSLAFAGGAQTLNNFTLNRAGANPALGSPLTVAGTLALTNGIITNTLANMLTVSNTAPGAVAAGGGYVDGFLERAFGAAGVYTFPVGQGAQPLPMTFTDDGTGTGTLIVNAQAGGGGTLGTAITSLYTTGRWELRNSIIGTRTGTVALTPSTAVPAVSVIGLSTTGIGGTYNSIGPALFLGGASIAQTLPQNFTNTSSFLATGSAIPLSTRYYFISGDASNPASWNSLPTGTGTVAPSFLIPGVTFYVMGNVSGISTTVATVQSNITLGAGAEIVVETPSVLGIADGVTLTNNGTVTVRGTTTTGATLLLDGTGAVTGTVVSYGSALARVQYSGSGTTRPTSPTEFPNVMPGTVVVDENVTVVLDDHKTLSSALV